MTSTPNINYFNNQLETEQIIDLDEHFAQRNNIPKEEKEKEKIRTGIEKVPDHLKNEGRNIRSSQSNINERKEPHNYYDILISICKF